MNCFKLLCGAAMLLSIQAAAQFSDDFSDGDFTENPTWTGSDQLFVVENEVLRSNSPGESNYYLSTPSSAIDDTQWQFYINLAFATSGANYVDVYLVSEVQDLLNAQNGYFLRFGGTPDEISLYKLVGGTETKIIDGEDGLIGSSSNNPFNVQVKRHSGGVWELFLDPGATGSFISGGSATDNTITTSSFFGLSITQSSAASPVNKHFFDNFEVGPIPQDNEPPHLETVQVQSSNGLLVTFSEEVLPASAENPTNYVVDGGIGSPVSVTYTAAGAALTFSTSFTEGQQYELTVSGVEDLNGNLMEPESQFFMYVVPVPGSYKSVVINEIMADPTPVVGLPEAEYLELYNSSDDYIDLGGWTLINSTTPKTLAPYLLGPDEYLILCDAAAAELFEEFGEVMPISSFVALANSGDSLTLLNSAGDLIDQVVYTSAWYKEDGTADGGYSLELINPTTECSGIANWRASSADSGGTPGAQNSVFDPTPDTTPPQFLSGIVISPQLVKLYFDENPSAESLTSAGFSLDGFSVTFAEAVSSEQAILLQVSPALQSGVSYSLNVSGIEDCEGNEMADFAVELLIGELPSVYELLITEIMADPTPSQGLPEAEYFELYNNSEHLLDISGCTVSGAVIPEGTLLQAGEYLICAGENQVLDFLLYPNVVGLSGMSSTFLTNSGRELVLKNPAGEILDAVHYDLSWYGSSGKQEGGYSLERKNLQEPCRGAENWAPSVDSDGGTPGAVNSVNSTTADVTPPALVSVMVVDETTLLLEFTERVDSVLAIMTAIEIAPELAVAEIEAVAPWYTSLKVVLQSPLQSGVIYSLWVSGVTDCTGNEMTEEYTASFGLPQTAEAGDILINEILFNPPTGGADFVEIYNNSSKIISLKDWTLANGSGSESTITTRPVSILPGEFLVFSDDIGFVQRQYPLGRPENYFALESMPSYASSGGSVILSDSAGVVMDEFDYDEDFHFALVTDAQGISLERISYTLATNDPGNWTSAAENVGFATPGYENSQHNPFQVSSDGFDIASEVFSPDNDGFEDVLSISYRLAQSETVASVTIYDMNGRIVRKLKENVLLAAEGIFTWDGTSDDRSKVPLGMYLIHVETFRMNGEVQHYKLICVVASSAG